MIAKSKPAASRSRARAVGSDPTPARRGGRRRRRPRRRTCPHVRLATRAASVSEADDVVSDLHRAHGDREAHVALADDDQLLRVHRRLRSGEERRRRVMTVRARIHSMVSANAVVERDRRDVGEQRREQARCLPGSPARHPPWVPMCCTVSRRPGDASRSAGSRRATSTASRKRGSPGRVDVTRRSMASADRAHHCSDKSEVSGLVPIPWTVSGSP